MESEEFESILRTSEVITKAKSFDQIKEKLGSKFVEGELSENIQNKEKKQTKKWNILVLVFLAVLVLMLSYVSFSVLIQFCENTGVLQEIIPIQENEEVNLFEEN